jgi:hypothetical protein
MPLWTKIAWTAVAALVVPVNWRAYGVANFLWFSDLALLLAVPALWLESPFLASTIAVAALLPETAWLVDFLVRLAFGKSPIGIADYMFDARTPRALRAVSLFHVFEAPLLVWMVARLGYDGRALAAQTVFGWMILVACYVWTDAAKNVNWVFGPGNSPQHAIPQPVYFALLLLLFPVAIYWPTHAVLRAAFGRG